jgi:hypothetical protein
MNILSQIKSASSESTTNERGAVKRFILATLSYAKHNGLKLTNKQVAELTRTNVPGSKTSAGSVADYITNLNSGLFDYYSESETLTVLTSFEKDLEPEAPTEPVKQVSPWSAMDLVYKARPKPRARKAKG